MKIGEIFIDTKKEIVKYLETKLNYISTKSPKTDLLICIQNVSENNTIKNQIQRQLNQDDGIFQIYYLECKQEEAYPCIDINFINKYVKVTDSILSDYNKTLEESDSIMEVDKNGNKKWKNKHGQVHRIGGPAIEWADGTKEWWVNGQLHRLDGPAVEYFDGTKEWWVNGQLHRLDGPAVEWPNGTKEWWLFNKRYKTKEKWEEAKKDWEKTKKELDSKIKNFKNTKQ